MIFCKAGYYFVKVKSFTDLGKKIFIRVQEALSNILSNDTICTVKNYVL